MQRDYVTVSSQAVGRPLEMLIFGHTGKPMLVFPSSAGRFFDYENFGMIATLAPFIDRGRLRVYCIDSLDHESWYAEKHPADKARRANDYDHAIAHDVVPFIRHHSGAAGRIMTHGCSFGAFHAANFWLKHPDLFDIAICLSGNYSIRFTVGDFCNDDVYFNDPLMYLPNLHDEGILRQMRQNLAMICHGQGAWEDWQEEARALVGHLRAREVPVLHDPWGHDVNHDWPWWKKQVIHFAGRLERAGLLDPHRIMDGATAGDFIRRFHEL